MKLGELRAFDLDQRFAVWTFRRAGLTAEIDSRQTWTVGEHTLTVTPWLDHDFRYVLLVRSGWPPPAPGSLSLAQVYAATVTGELRDFKRRRVFERDPMTNAPTRSEAKPSPELARWKARALIESGTVEPPRIDMRKLPDDAPESARVTWGVVGSLVQVRRLTDEDDVMPLSVPFLRLWSGLDEDLLIAGRRWLDRHEFITRSGTLRTGAGKPMVLWRVAVLPQHEQDILNDLFDLLDAHEVER